MAQQKFLCRTRLPGLRTTGTMKRVDSLHLRKKLIPIDKLTIISIFRWWMGSNIVLYLKCRLFRWFFSCFELFFSVRQLDCSQSPLCFCILNSLTRWWCMTMMTSPFLNCFHEHCSFSTDFSLVFLLSQFSLAADFRFSTFTLTISKIYDLLFSHNWIGIMGSLCTMQAPRWEWRRYLLSI